MFSSVSAVSGQTLFSAPVQPASSCWMTTRPAETVRDTHAHTHTPHTDAHTHTDARSHTHRCTLTLTHALSHTQMHARSYTHTHTHMPHTRAHTLTHTQMHARSHTHAHTHTLTLTHRPQNQIRILNQCSDFCSGNVCKSMHFN